MVAATQTGGRNMCNSCEVLNINGVNCHESGCPDAWMDYSKECKWCGSSFKPEEEYQECCCDSCAECLYD
jgi:hypothetical protein